ncbi:MAG: hypothetical protein MI794_18915 [Pseudomonadales bacterium]|nr:hypothetical protein [Pseudomonadales bacterium]
MRIRQVSQARFRRATVVIGAMALVLAPVSLQAQEQNQDVLTEQTEDFLADRSSVGALVGGILAGAAFANPFAPLGGTILGFFVGKSTDYSEDESEARSVAQRRGFAPSGSDGQPVAALALSGGDAGTGEALSLSESTPTVAPVPVSAEPSSQPADGRLASLERGTMISTESASAASTPRHTPEQDDVADITVTAAPAGLPMQRTRQGQGAASDAGAADTYEPVHPIITEDVGGTQEKLDELAAIIRAEQGRPEFVPHERCPSNRAPGYRKKIAVAGFAVETPEQGVLGGFEQPGQRVSELLYQRFQQAHQVQPYAAPQQLMYASLEQTPHWTEFDNRLRDYSAVSRQMGVQFVVSGVIRNLGVRNGEAWDTSVYSGLQRRWSGADTTRDFVVDVVVHDGYTGRVVIEKRYAASGRWDLPRTERAGFGSARFMSTGYGVAVDNLLADISDDITDKIACQPMLVPILEVKGRDLLLDIGTKSGLLPGARMELVRSETSLMRPDAPPQLWETGVELHIHSLSLDTSRAWMPQTGGELNIQQGDYAVIY